MNNELYERLNGMSPDELTQFYKDFILEIQHSPSKYGGFSNLGQAIKILNKAEYKLMDVKLFGKLDNSKLERVNKILRSSSFREAIAKENGEGTRKDIRTLYLSYLKGKDFSDDVARYAYVVDKVKSYLIFSIMEMSNAWSYKYNLEKGKLEYFEKGPTSKEISFACYYWYEGIKTIRKVDIGLLELTFEENENYHQVTKAVMKLFSDTETEKYLSILYSEKVIDNTDGTLFIYLKDSHLPIYSHLVLHRGRVFPEQMNVVIGTYSTIGRRHKDLPLAGVILLEKKSKDELKKFPLERLKKDYVRPEVISFLFRSRLKGTTEMIQEITDLPTHKEVKFIGKYVGRYQGIYYRKGKHQSLLPANSIERFVLEIYNTGDAIMILPGLHIGEQSRYEGRIRVAQIKNDALIGFFDLLAANNVYRYTIYINKEFKGDKKDELYAVYAGIERHDPFVPVAGRMKFKRIQKNGTESEPQKQDFTNYVYRESLEEFLVDPDSADLANLFRGNGKEDYVETISSFRFGSNLSYEKALVEFAATYNVYFLSTRQNKIYRIPIKLYPNGKVEMKTRKPNPTGLHEGFANFNGHNRLSFYIRKENEPNSFFHLLFNTGNNSYEANHFFGISSKFDEAERPAARLEVLVKSNDEFDIAKAKVFDVFSEEYHKEDTLTNGLLSYLTGNDNRIIVTKRTPDSKFQRNVQMKQVFFHAACHLYSKERYEESLQSLYQAFLHGFAQDPSEKKSLSSELNLSFNGANEMHLAAAPTDSELPHLTFKELFSRMLSNLPELP